MSTRQFIDALASGSSFDIENNFNSIVAEKIATALDARRVEIAQSLFATEEVEEDFVLEDFSVEELEEFMQTEEFEQLDELSKKTLGNYVNKANREVKDTKDSIRDTLDSARRFGADKDPDVRHEIDTNRAVVSRRERGIKKASQRLAKEDFSLDDFTVEELEDFMQTEDFEQLDELSRKTLSSYVGKASRDAADKASQYGAKKSERDEVDRSLNRHMHSSDKDKIRSIMKVTTKDVEDPLQKTRKRLHGITQASKRLAK